MIYRGLFCRVLSRRSTFLSNEIRPQMLISSYNSVKRFSSFDKLPERKPVEHAHTSAEHARSAVPRVREQRNEFDRQQAGAHDKKFEEGKVYARIGLMLISAGYMGYMMKRTYDTMNFMSNGEQMKKVHGNGHLTHLDNTKIEDARGRRIASGMVLNSPEDKKE